MWRTLMRGAPPPARARLELSPDPPRTQAEPVFLQMGASYFVFGLGMGGSYVLIANLLTKEESFGLLGDEAVARVPAPPITHAGRSS